MSTPAQTPPRLIYLPRRMSAQVISGLVHLAVELNEATGRRKWSTHFTLKREPDGLRFMLGQNSCCLNARLQVRPKNGALFDCRNGYAHIEVAWCPAWRAIACEGHSHGTTTREDAINALSDRIERLAEAIRHE